MTAFETSVLKYNVRSISRDNQCFIQKVTETSVVKINLHYNRYRYCNPLSVYTLITNADCDVIKSLQN